MCWISLNKSLIENRYFTNWGVRSNPFEELNSLKEVKTFWVNAGIIKGALATTQVELINYVFCKK